MASDSEHHHYAASQPNLTGSSALEAKPSPIIEDDDGEQDDTVVASQYNSRAPDANHHHHNTEPPLSTSTVSRTLDGHGSLVGFESTKPPGCSWCRHQDKFHRNPTPFKVSIRDGVKLMSLGWRMLSFVNRERALGRGMAIVVCIGDRSLVVVFALSLSFDQTMHATEIRRCMLIAISSLFVGH
jgi:hypothetical protein